jgi:mono/diheme cytochrome c family protein
MQHSSDRAIVAEWLKGGALVCAMAALLAARAVLGDATVSASPAAQEHQHPGTTAAHRHPEAAKIRNPIPADTGSVAAGRELYAHHCADCHGDTGKGDGPMGEELDPKPADFTDATWKHGSSDGEIFTVIRDGVKRTGMKAFGRKLAAHQMWDLVNYLRSIGPAPAKSH